MGCRPQYPSEGPQWYGQPTSSEHSAASAERRFRPFQWRTSMRPDGWTRAIEEATVDRRWRAIGLIEQLGEQLFAGLGVLDNDRAHRAVLRGLKDLLFAVAGRVDRLRLAI